MSNISTLDKNILNDTFSYESRNKFYWTKLKFCYELQINLILQIRGQNRNKPQNYWIQL
jgi:hypothetical protein